MTTSIKMTRIQAAQIHREAVAAAEIAATKAGEDMYCGFAWVNIKPARGEFVKYLKEESKASKSYSGGVDVWSSEAAPITRTSQSMTFKEAACGAYAGVLRKYGINAYMVSRAD